MWSEAGIVTGEQAGSTHIRRAVNCVGYQGEGVGGVSLMWFAILFLFFPKQVCAVEKLYSDHSKYNLDL